MARCEFPKITCTCAKDVCNFLECPGYYNIQWRATRDRVFNPHISNADRIRSMTDEELANWYFDKFFPCVPYCSTLDKCPEHDDCKICLLEWLKKERAP